MRVKPVVVQVRMRDQDAKKVWIAATHRDSIGDRRCRVGRCVQGETEVLEQAPSILLQSAQLPPIYLLPRRIQASCG